MKDNVPRERRSLRMTWFLVAMVAAEWIAICELTIRELAR